MRIAPLFLCLLLAYSPAAWAVNVVTSIKPLHSLASLVLQGSGHMPVLLLKDNHSLHHYSLKPSEVEAIHQADIIFFISPELETFLPRILHTTPKTLQAVAMAQQTDILLLPQRSLHHGEADKPTYDLHIWASPANAKVILHTIADRLASLDPAQAELYQRNSKAAIERLTAQDMALKMRLSKLADKPFLTFHDATQYFDHHYGLTYAGSVTLSPERGSSASDIRQLQEKIKAQHIGCIFAEPHFNAKAMTQLAGDSAIKVKTIDPSGSQLSPSPFLYFEWLEKLAKDFESCLN